MWLLRQVVMRCAVRAFHTSTLVSSSGFTLLRGKRFHPDSIIVDELDSVVCEYCEGFPYKSTKMEGIFFIDYGSSAFILRFDLAQIVFCSTLQALECELLGV